VDDSTAELLLFKWALYTLPVGDVGFIDSSKKIDEILSMATFLPAMGSLQEEQI